MASLLKMCSLQLPAFRFCYTFLSHAEKLIINLLDVRAVTLWFLFWYQWSVFFIIHELGYLRAIYRLYQLFLLSFQPGKRMIKKMILPWSAQKPPHPLYDYFPFASLLRLIFNPFGMCHTYVIREFLNQISTWGESSALQKCDAPVQPYYTVLKYKKGYIFNFSSPIFTLTMTLVTLVTLSPCSFLISQAHHQQFDYFFLLFKTIMTRLLLHILLFL